MRDLFSVDVHRVRNLSRMDLHRMFHGKTFYIMLCIAAYIPVMMLTQMGDVTADLTVFLAGTDSISGLSGGMTFAMLNTLTGLLLCAYIGREYQSGLIKNIVTAHANKFDYIFAKGVMALICTLSLTAVHLAALFLAGAALGYVITVPSIFGLILFVVERLILSIPMSMLVIAANLVFRRRYGWSMIVTFFASMGILVMAAQQALQGFGLEGVSKLLNFTIAGASAFTSLTPSPAIILVVVIAAAWSVIYALAGSFLMNRRDIL